MKKKLFAGVMIFTMIFSLFTFTAFADEPTEYCEGDFYYILEGGSACITGYFGRDAEATVPAMIGSYPVNVIKNGAFIGTTIRTLYLPDTVMNIEPNAIESDVKVVYNSNLKETGEGGEVEKSPLDGYTYIKTPEGFMTEIGPDGAKIISFDASKLPEDKKLTIPSKVNGMDVVEIADNIFSEVQVEELQVPSCVKRIGQLSNVTKTILDYDTDNPRVYEIKPENGEIITDVDVEEAIEGKKNPSTYVVTTDDGLIAEINNGQATIIGTDKDRLPTDGNVKIPDSIDGSRVIGIKEGAMKDSGVKKIEIENPDVNRGNVEKDVPTVLQKNDNGDMETIGGNNYTWVYIVIGCVLILGGLGYLIFSKKIGKKDKEEAKEATVPKEEK